LSDQIRRSLRMPSISYYRGTSKAEPTLALALIFSGFKGGAIASIYRSPATHRSTALEPAVSLFAEGYCASLLFLPDQFQGHVTV
jgi:hypothetical protein